jgi:hypothetical protein
MACPLPTSYAQFRIDPVAHHCQLQTALATSENVMQLIEIVAIFSKRHH